MSALTKIFVVLHVVVSLLLASALIVFVNKQENFQTLYKTASQQKTLAEGKATQKDQDNIKLAADKTAMAAELQGQINTLKTAVATAEASSTQLQGQLAEKDATITQLTTSNTSLTAALQVATADIKARQEGYNALAIEKDKIQKQSAESDNKITELTSANDVLLHQSKLNQEQIAQLQQQNSQYGETLRKYNISPTGTTPPAGGAINTTPSVNINGIVRDFKNINGVPFATISLGSADAVTHGMKFNVIDPAKKQFLGYLTVDSVGIHEATGRLDGPAVNQVRANVSEVRTQL